MELNIEFLKNYIINNIAGTEEDNEFIKNLSNIALVKNEDIYNYKNYIEYNISQIKNYIDSNKERNGIKAIEDIFGFIGDFNFQKENGNFYLFVGNVKIKAVALMCRMYLFIEKYQKHATDKLDERRGNAHKTTIWYIKNYIEGKEIESLLKSLTEKYEPIEKYKYNESDYKGYCLKHDDEQYCYFLEEKNKDEKSNAKSYKMSKECKKSAEIICHLISKKLELDTLDDKTIGEIVNIINLISEKTIENKIAEFKEQEKMLGFLKDEHNKNRSLRYFLFDNRMKEVEFFGVENRFNWLWEQEQGVCLYRNVTEKDPYDNLEEKKSYEYMSELMKHIISHASGKNYHKANSYSRNPIRDFYKYIDIGFPEKAPYEFNFEVNININNNSENEFFVTSEQINVDFNLVVNMKAKFEFIENATTNSLKITTDSTSREEVSFYNYLKKNEGDYSKTQFCIEYCKENSIVPADSGRRLRKLNDYLHTWGVTENFHYSYISDNDDEVITSTDYFSDNQKNIYELNFIQILAVMYGLYDLEAPSIDNKADRLKKKIKYHFENEIKEKIKKEKIIENLNNVNNNSNQSLKLDEGVAVTITINNLHSFAEETKENMIKLIKLLENKLNYIAKNIAEEISKTIYDKINDNSNDTVVKNVIEAIKKGINKKELYKNARKEKFKFYTELNGNKINNFWKQLFKDM
ncbi:MAG: hypothetical protein ACLR8H_11520 [Clostridium sp.]